MLAFALSCKKCQKKFSSKNVNQKFCCRNCVAKTHGMSNTKVYRAYRGMVSRCNPKNHLNYKWYGARGITVSKDWLKFENFFRDMGHPPGKNYSLDRIDNNKGYSKKNCRWATQSQQNNNMSTTVLLKHNGETLSQSEWSRKLGIPLSTIFNRRKRGCSVSEVLKKRKV